MAEELGFPEQIGEDRVPEDEEYEEDPRIAMMGDMLADQKRTNAELVKAVTQAVRPQVPAGQPLQRDAVNPELAFSLEGLPDPQYDVKAFHAAYAKRASEVVGRALTQTENRAAERAAQMMIDKEVRDRADEAVREALPWANKEARGYAAGVVANRLRAEGKDAMTELRDHFDDVTQEMVDHLNDTFPQGAQPRAPRRPETGGGRTQGLVSARGRSPGRPSATPKGENPKEFFQQLTAVQAKARLY